MYCILFIFDLKIHDSNEIYMFCFLLLCICVNLDWFDWKTFVRNMKSAKINTNTFFFCFKISNSLKDKFPQNATKTPFAKIITAKIYNNKVHLGSCRWSDESKKSERQVVLEYSMGLLSGLVYSSFCATEQYSEK